MKGEGTHLGPRVTGFDRALAELVAEGLRNPEIAEKLGYAAGTIGHRLGRLYDYFDVPRPNRVLLAFAIQRHMELEYLMGE